MKRMIQSVLYKGDVLPGTKRCLLSSESAVSSLEQNLVDVWENFNKEAYVHILITAGCSFSVDMSQLRLSSIEILSKKLLGSSVISEWYGRAMLSAYSSLFSSARRSRCFYWWQKVIGFSFFSRIKTKKTQQRLDAERVLI